MDLHATRSCHSPSRHLSLLLPRHHYPLGSGLQRYRLLFQLLHQLDTIRHRILFCILRLPWHQIPPDGNCSASTLGQLAARTPCRILHHCRHIPHHRNGRILGAFGWRRRYCWSQGLVDGGKKPLRVLLSQPVSMFRSFRPKSLGTRPQTPVRILAALLNNFYSRKGNVVARSTGFEAADGMGWKVPCFLLNLHVWLRHL